MRAVIILAAAAASAACILTSQQMALAQDGAIPIAAVQNLSGPFAARGEGLLAIYKKNIDKINQEGGLTVGPKKRKITLVCARLSINASTSLRKAHVRDHRAQSGGRNL
jgi:hypothetical protein